MPIYHNAETGTYFDGLTDDDVFTLAAQQAADAGMTLDGATDDDIGALAYQYIESHESELHDAQYRAAGATPSSELQAQTIPETQPATLEGALDSLTADLRAQRDRS